MVAAHLKQIVKAAGGRIKRSALGAQAYKALRADPNGSAICTRMVNEEFLALEQGWTYDKMTITVK